MHRTLCNLLGATVVASTMLSIAACGSSSSQSSKPTELTSATVSGSREATLQAENARLQKERDEAKSRLNSYMQLQQERNDFEQRAVAKLDEIDRYAFMLHQKIPKSGGPEKARIEKVLKDAAGQFADIERDLERAHNETEEQDFQKLSADIDGRLDTLGGTLRAAAQQQQPQK